MSHEYIVYLILVLMLIIQHMNRKACCTLHSLQIRHNATTAKGARLEAEANDLRDQLTRGRLRSMDLKLQAMGATNDLIRDHEQKN